MEGGSSRGLYTRRRHQHCNWRAWNLGLLRADLTIACRVACQIKDGQVQIEASMAVRQADGDPSVSSILAVLRKWCQMLTSLSSVGRGRIEGGSVNNKVVRVGGAKKA